MNELDRLKTEKERAEKELRQLENRQKMLLNKQRDAERRLRTRRLIERGAMLESVFPELTSWDNKGVMAFLIVVSRLPQIAEWLAKAAKLEDAEQPSLD